MRVYSLKLLLLLVLVLNLAGWGCAHAPPAADARGERVRQILAGQPDTPQGKLERGLARLVHRNHLAGALLDLQEASHALPAQEKSAQALARLAAGLVHLFRLELDEALGEFLEAAAADVRLPESLVAALQLGEIVHQVPAGHQRVEARVRALLQSTPPPPADTARALRLILKDGALRRGSTGDTDAVLAQMGAAPIFWTAFPFGRHPLVDFDFAFPPEGAPLAAAEAAALLPNRPENGVLVLDREGRGGMLYAEAAFLVECSPEEDCPPCLSVRIESEGPWAAFADDVLLRVHDAHRRMLPRVARLSFRAGAGWHRLLFKVPLREAEHALAVELTRCDGRPAPVEWWSSADRPAPLRFGSSIQTQPAVPEPHRQLLQLASSSFQEPLAPTLAALLAWADGDLEAARLNLLEAERREPRFAQPHYLLGLLALEDPSLPRRLDLARSREHLQRAVDLCPDSLLGRFRLALLDGGEGKELEALQALQKLQHLRPGAFVWPFYQGHLYQKLGWELQADRAYRAALAVLPDHQETLRRLLVRALRHGAAAEADRLAGRLFTPGSADEELVRLAIAREDFDGAGSLLAGIIERFPSRLAPRLTLFNLLVGREDLRGASQVLEAAERLAAHSPALLQRRADLLDRLGRHQQAGEVRKKLTTANPADLQARRAWSAAGGEHGRIRVFGERRFDAHSLIAAYRSAASTPSGNSVLLLDSLAVEVAADGSSLERVHLLAQVRTQEGLEQWGEIKDIPEGAVIDELRTMTADGRSHAATPIPGKDTISMPALQLGDFVEVSYVLGRPGQAWGGSGAEYVGRRWYFRAPGMPVIFSRYSVAVPAGTPLEVDTHGERIRAEITRQEGYDLYVWTGRDAPMIPLEQNAPSLDEITPFVQVGFGLDWKDVRDRMRLALEESARPSLDLIRFAEQAVEGADDQRQRLRRLLATVSAQVRQVGPHDYLDQPAAHILARREGNRLVLLYSLLRILGYRPQALVARTISDSPIDYRFPNDTTYRHGLLLVEIGGERVWLDPSNRHNAFGVLYPYLQGMTALEITSPAGSHPFAILPGEQGISLAREIILDLSLDSAGELRGSGVEHIGTAQAVTYRTLLDSLNEQQRREVLQVGLGNYFSGAVLENQRIVGLDDPDRPLILEYRFRVPAFAERRNRHLIIRGGFYPYRLGASLITKPERRLPLMLQDETRTHTRVTLRLPPGAALRPIEPASLRAPSSSFSFAVRQEDGRLILEKSLLVKAGRILPGDYPAFRDFCREVDAKDTEDIVVRLP